MQCKSAAEHGVDMLMIDFLPQHHAWREQLIDKIAYHVGVMRDHCALLGQANDRQQADHALRTRREEDAMLNVLWHILNSESCFHVPRAASLIGFIFAAPPRPGNQMTRMIRSVPLLLSSISATGGMQRITLLQGDTPCVTNFIVLQWDANK
jgi:hypothetical protein